MSSVGVIEIVKGLKGEPGANTRATLAVVTKDTENKRSRAMRNFWVALTGVSTTAIDVLWGPSDSIGEGAYATAWSKTDYNVARDAIRRAVQPAGIVGGGGYHSPATNVFLVGAPTTSTTGTVTLSNAYGLGRKASILAPGATYTWTVTASKLDMMFTTGTTGGTYSISWGDTSTSTGTTNSVSLAHTKVTKTYSSSATRTVTLTNTDSTLSVYVEGIFQYNGDEVAGIRMWEAAHSGYMAENYTSSTEWANSLQFIPNCKLVVLPIGSNDFYAGYTAAQTKTKIQTIISTLRTKLGTNPSILLVGYFDRPAPAKTEEWTKFTEMYQSIADADLDIDFLDLVPVFGPKVSDTDTRGGLCNASDFVHPTDAGHALIGQKVAEAVLPIGINNGGVFNYVSDANKQVSTLQAAAIADAKNSGDQGVTLLSNNVSGALNFNGAFVNQQSRIVLNGNASLSSAGMPTTVAGTSRTWHLTVENDATGGRVFTLSGFLKVGSYPTGSTTANAKDLYIFYYDGARWWLIQSLIGGT